MGETFFININCSKVLENCDESQYTMFIDSRKMSIVYELTEWIRWMFSVDHCFFLIHENSVIHELEDIQFLAKLKNFEIRPCGQRNCVHKKMYRTLLDNLNLFVSWNNVKVHKYFLDKLSKIGMKFNQENQIGSDLLNFNGNATVIRNSINHNTKSDDIKVLSNNIRSDSDLGSTTLTKKQVLVDNYISKQESDHKFLIDMSCNENASQDVLVNFKDNFNSLNDSNNSEKNVMSGAEKTNKTAINFSNPTKKDLAIKLNDKNLTKSSMYKKSQKHMRPFSVGELLSNIREEFKNQSLDETNEMVTSPQISTLEEENFLFNSNSFVSASNSVGGRKRPRTRRRKRSKKENPEEDEHISSFFHSVLDTSNTECNLGIHKSSKPNHIRFDIENDDDLMKTECMRSEFVTENQNGTKSDEDLKDSTKKFLQTEPKILFTTICNRNQDLKVQMESGFPINNTGNKMECCSGDDAQTETVTKLIDVDNETLESGNQSCSTLETSKPINQDLNLFLTLKEKFKNAVVVERFY